MSETAGVRNGNGKGRFLSERRSPITRAMEQHLAEISSQVAEDAHAVLVVDGAGWHCSRDLAIPDNITLICLPPYSPELEPVRIPAGSHRFPLSCRMGAATHGRATTENSPQRS